MLLDKYKVIRIMITPSMRINLILYWKIRSSEIQLLIIKVNGLTIIPVQM